jgi:hypothetical protein
MGRRTQHIVVAAISALLAVWQVTARAAGPIDANMPQLRKHGQATQMYVENQPFLMLAGELHNSSTSSVMYMRPLWPVLAQRNYNTLLGVVTWEQIEPVEGQFDFATVDGIVADARKNNLKLVILWFGSWKNGESSYQPLWVKRDPARFPMAEGKDGTKLRMLSTFNENNANADAKAFAALMKHLRETDTAHTVLMIQVENEVGVLRDSRDRCAKAVAAYNGPVPAELMDYIVKHKDSLVSEFADVWKANGSKTSGTWAEVFGPGKPDSVDVPVSTANLNPPMDKQEHDLVAWRKLYWSSDEFFMAWNYSRYLNTVASAGKAEYNIPMYCNVWQQEPDHPWPGMYPCGGAQAQCLNIWQCGAPSIDLLAPDLYVTNFFDDVANRYTRSGNPLFIPETAAIPGNAIDAIFKHNSMGFSPFGIDGALAGGRDGGPAAAAADPLAQTYAVLNYLSQDVLDCQATGSLVQLPAVASGEQGQQDVKLGNFTLTVKYGSGGTIGGTAGGAGRGGGAGGRGRGGARGAGGAATPTTEPQIAPVGPQPVQNVFPGAIVLMPRPDEYVIAGANLNVTYKPNSGGSTVKLGYFEESIYADGKWYKGRRLNGDETGNNLRWPALSTGFGVYKVAVLPGE